MQNQNKKLDVTDLSTYLYCPRKYYLTKILKIKEPLNEKMAKGKLKHLVLNILNQKEPEIIESIQKQISEEEIVFMYNKKIKSIIDYIFETSSETKIFKINKEIFLSDFIESSKKEIVYKAKSIKSLTDKKIFGKDILYYLASQKTEFKIESDFLVGKIDKVSFEKDMVIPYEIKNKEEIFYPDIIQLTAYAILAESHFKKKITFGFIELNSRKERIEITDKLKKEVFSLISEIQNLKSLPKFPSNLKKCNNCTIQKKCYSL